MKYFLAGIFALIFFIVQVLTLTFYGMNWDSPFRFMRGQTYLHLFLTGKGTFGIHRNLSPIIFHANERVSRFDYLDGEGDINVKLPPRPLFLQEFKSLQKKLGKSFSFYQDDYFSLNFFKKNDGGHPPFPDIMAAISNKIFYQNLHVLDDVHSYQLVDSLFGSIGVFVVFVFTYEIIELLGFSKISTIFGAFIAASTLGLYPLFFSDSHFNMKEPLIASLYAGAVWTFWKWFTTNKKRWFAGFVACVAVSFSTKWNVVLLPAVLLPWLAFQIKTQEFKKWFGFKKIILCLILLLTTSYLLLILIWPYTWSDPVGKLYQTYLYYKDLAFQAEGSNQPPGYLWLFGINLYPSFLVLISTPEVVLLLSFFGLFGSFFLKKSRTIGILLLFWLIVPIAKMSWPGVWFYNGMRQEIEALPALAVLTGIGFVSVFHVILRLQPKDLISGKGILRFAQNDKSPQNKIKRLRMAVVILSSLLIFCLLAYPVIHLFPNENLYFNSFVGGVKGAFAKNLINQKKNYGNIYKQAADWLNKYAEKNANLAILTGNEFALSPTFLRPDISISPYHFSGLYQKGEYVLEAYDPWNQTIFSYKYLYRFLHPVHTIYLDGGPILKIFRNSPIQLKPDFRKEQTTKEFALSVSQTSIGRQIRIRLNAIEHITRIVVRDAPENCQNVSFKFGDESVAFYSRDGVRNSFYVFDEKTLLAANKIMYSFPGTPAQFIEISTINNYSCFLKGNIDSVSFLP